MNRRAFRRAAATLATTVLVAAISASGASAASTFYVANSSSSSLTGFNVGDNGLPVSVGAPVPTVAVPRTVNFSPDATRLFQTNYTAPSASAWAINSAGGLTSLGAAVTTPNSSASSAIAPNGSTQYFSSGFNDAGVQAFRINADGSQQLIDSEFTDGNGDELVVTPDGTRLYSCSGYGVWGFSIAADGLLTAPPELSPVPGVPGCNALAVTPDGATLLLDSPSNTVTSRHINSDGSLTAINTVPGGLRPVNLAVGPSGNYVISFGLGNGPGTQPTVTSIAIAPDGTLTGGGPIFNTGAAGTFGSGGAVSPDGSVAYQHISTAGNNLFGFAVSGGGSIVPLAGSPFASGGTSNFQAHEAIAFKPFQGPVAKLAVSGRGATRTLSAEGSIDADSPIVTYEWNFGKGEEIGTASPILTHRFETPGVYTATVRAVSGGGCGVNLIYTGRYTLCNPGKTASVSVDALPPVIKKLKLTRTKFKVNKKAKAPKIAKKVAAGTLIKYALSEPATLKIQVEKPAGGRKVGRSCVKPGKSNKKKKPCVRYVSLGTALNLSARAGNRSTPFSGKVKSKVLKAGKYRLVLLASDAEGNTSKLSTAKFRIVK